MVSGFAPEFDARNTVTAIAPMGQSHPIRLSCQYCVSVPRMTSIAYAESGLPNELAFCCAAAGGRSSLMVPSPGMEGKSQLGQPEPRQQKRPVRHQAT